MTKIMEANVDNLKKYRVYEKELEKIFSNVNNWLKFAEARHAILLTLNGTFLFNIKDNSSLWFPIVLVFITISIFVSLYSFLYDLYNKNHINLNLNSKNNLLFYGDIAKYSISQYRCYIADLFDKHSNYTKLEEYYAEEIIINSQITYKKYEWFKISILSFMVAVLFYIVNLF